MFNRKVVYSRVLVLVLFLALVFMVAGCTEQGGAAEEGEGDENLQEIVETPQSLKIALGMAIGGLDPHASLAGDARIIWSNIYETLVYLDENMTVQPRLATSWEVSEDAKTWTFWLRENVQFSDGTAFNAGAVKFTLERLMAKNPFAVGVEIEEIVVVDEYKVRFILKQPFVPLLSELTRARSSIISPTSVLESEDFKPVGTGPFVFENWFKEEKIVLRSNDTYWAGTPQISEVTFKIIPDAHTRVMAFEAGEIDILGVGFGHIPIEEVQRLRGNAAVQIETRSPAHNTVWLALNQENKFLADRQVREAVNYAIDVESIVKYVLEGAAELAVAPWSPAKIFGLAPKLQLPGYDTVKAQELLTASGWTDTDNDGILDKDGETAWLTLTVQNVAPWRSLAEVVQEQLRRVGIGLEIVELERGTYMELVRAGDFEMIGISGLGLPSNDPYMHISNFYHSRYGFRIGAEAPNPSLIDSRELDSLIEKIIKTVDPEARKTIYHKIQEMVVGEMVGVYLYHSSLFTALPQDISGFEISGGFWNLCLRNVGWD